MITLLLVPRTLLKTIFWTILQKTGSELGPVHVYEIVKRFNLVTSSIRNTLKLLD